MSKSRPRLLIFCRQTHPITAARLPRELTKVGWSVASMCKKDSLLWQTRFVDKKYVCPNTPRKILWPLIQALKNWEPDFVVPGDRWSLRYLQGMASSWIIESLFPRVAGLLHWSIGAPDAYGVLDSKVSLLEMASEIDGVQTPKSTKVNSVHNALSIVNKRYRFPVVLKREHLSGGTGVKLCNNNKDVKLAFRTLSEKEPRTSLPKYIWKQWNLFPFMVGIDDPGEISVQEYIDGEPFLYSFVAIGGRILAGNTVRRKLPYDGITSPHCRYEIRENKRIREVASSIVGNVNFSGFGCFDFIVDKSGSIPYLIECNPFPVNIAHLGHVLGEDLCEALFREVAETNDVKERDLKEEEKGTAVLFPYELCREKSSTKIESKDHDVPYDDPKLLKEIQKRFGVELDNARVVEDKKAHRK